VSLAVANKYYFLPFTVLFVCSPPSLEFGIRPTDFVTGCLPITLFLSLSEVVIAIITLFIEETTTHVALGVSLPAWSTHIS
jgi:hypothetical protein